MLLASPAISFIAESQFGLKNWFGFNIIIHCFKGTGASLFSALIILMTGGFETN